MKIHRSVFGLAQDLEKLEDQFDRLSENPNTVLKEQQKRMAPMVEAIKETVATKGWQDVIRPFLEKHGDSDKLFGLFKKKMDDVEKAFMAGKTEAYHNFIMLIENILKFEIKEDQEKE
jgi:hypothetical protein